MDCFKIEKDKTLIRIFNALPFQEAVDVYVGGLLLFPNVKYEEFTEYIYLVKDIHNIDVYKQGTLTKPLIKISFPLPLDQVITLAITGDVGEETIVTVLEDPGQLPSKESAIGRTVNLAPSLEDVNFLYNGVPSLDHVSYRDETPYVDIPPGEYEVEMEDGVTGDQIAKGRFNYKAERIYTMYVIGDSNNIKLIQAVDGNTYVCR